MESKEAFANVLLAGSVTRYIMECIDNEVRKELFIRIVTTAPKASVLLLPEEIRYEVIKLIDDRVWFRFEKAVIRTYHRRLWENGVEIPDTFLPLQV